MSDITALCLLGSVALIVVGAVIIGVLWSPKIRWQIDTRAEHFHEWEVMTTYPKKQEAATTVKCSHPNCQCLQPCSAYAPGKAQ